MTVQITPTETEQLTISELKEWFFQIKNVIRGGVQTSQYVECIAPLIVYKRISDVFDDELSVEAKRHEKVDIARKHLEEDHTSKLNDKGLPIASFYIPEKCSWETMRKQPRNRIAKYLTDCLADIVSVNPDMAQILDIFDYRAIHEDQRIINDYHLVSLIDVISKHHLGNENLNPVNLVKTLSIFAESQGGFDGEIYTPDEVSYLMAELLDIQPNSTVYDPACGSGGLLIYARKVFECNHPDKAIEAPHLYGQELNSATCAIAKFNMIINDYPADFVNGDTLADPGFDVIGDGLMRFDRITANPVWNQQDYETCFENDPYRRFRRWIPPNRSADWGWVLHVLASLKDGGRAAILLDTGALSRGSGSIKNNRERDIRREVIKADLVEGVILLPENLFYNTRSPGIILLLRKGKPDSRKEQMLLVDASDYYENHRPKKRLTQQGIQDIKHAFGTWQKYNKLCSLVTIDDLRKVDYNLNPVQFIDAANRTELNPLDNILQELADAKLEREQAEQELSAMMGYIIPTPSQRLDMLLANLNDFTECNFDDSDFDTLDI